MPLNTMLKPFFQSMSNRFGPSIGHGAERGMLDAVGGVFGIRKKFQRNADGSTTMLQTRGGMPRFITTRNAMEDPILTISSTSVPDTQAPGVPTPSVHTVTVANPARRRIGLSFIDGTAIAGVHYRSVLTDTDFSNGVTITSGVILVPRSVSTFTITVDFMGGAANTFGITRTYTIHLGTVSAQGELFGI